MAMNVQSADHDEVELNTTINTTPLVDVMLVLLIIFLITIPVIVKTVPLTLPNARACYASNGSVRRITPGIGSRKWCASRAG